ncbi:cysteine-rich venom protein kaouthin-2-like [Paramacrobiotus metropolitanus]|uniref:cysteine-rich venom protein kaouthin-2-like n=1 Tax=Paramacrobiotus metropolitanus TaxID=2943436 RepID=UPI002445B4B7|nr:cysteine-rich venom protein kaouthin-2-like [Paramacrobiotus metropolitanus]
MKVAVALALAALIGVAYGATYLQNPQIPGGEEAEINPNERVIHQHEPVPDLPDPGSTLHEGLIFNGKNAGKRTVKGAADLATASGSVQKTIVDYHNEKRREVKGKNEMRMQWHAKASQIAQAWADKCDFRHPTTDQEKKTFLNILLKKDTNCGQSIAMGSGDMTWKQAMDMWYNEKKDFKWGVDTGKVVGHYTAMVWKTSRFVGCGYKLCKAGTPQQFHFFVCDYAPGGNVYPNHLKPYDAGNPCDSCKGACENGLCTNACEYENKLSNCENPSGNYPALFANGCDKADSMMDSMKAQCEATCNCKGKSLY